MFGKILTRHMCLTLVVIEIYETVNNIGLITGKGIISGKYQAFEFNHIVLFTDIFKLVDGNWKYYKSQVTEIKTT